jgi:transcriptional regulator with XRE-family HTH domain
MATVHLVGPKHGWVLDGDAPVDLRARLGQWLRRAREARGLTVAAVAAETKIPQRHLEALERGDAMGLPAFYQRAEIRTVAHAVGADEQLALAQLQAALAPATLPPESPARPTAVRTAHLLAALGVGALTVALLGWGILDRAATSQGRPAAVEQTAGTTEARSTPAPAQSADVTPLHEAAVVEPAVIATPAAAAPAELVITTQPEGARVTVNGVGWGVSPVTIRHLPPGAKRIRVTKSGYAASERSVTTDDGGRQAVRIELNVEGGL